MNRDFIPKPEPISALIRYAIVLFTSVLLIFGVATCKAYAEGVEKNPCVNVHGGDKELSDPEPMFTEDEEWELLHIAQAEAGNQGVIGQALVMRVVLNRVEDGYWGDSIHEVLTYPNQFSTVRSGSWYREPNADSYEALELIRGGWDESQGALYFRTASGHFAWATYLFTYGNHNFYT